MDITYSFMIPLMELFAKATHSYGWSIILLTLLVRLCVWPLVASSTKSMKRMATLQPKLKQLQEKYKDDPETFRQKSMEFYSTNKMNPLGGCLPTLVQFPILIALFATFTGPPFQDKDIPVKVNLAKPADAATVKIVNNPTSGATSPYVSPEGKKAKFAVQPGDQTLVWGRDAAGKQIDQPNTIDFHITALEGDPPAGFKPGWKIEHDPNGATIDVQGGGANFPRAGDVTVQAKFPDGQIIEVPLKVEGEQQQSGGFPNIFGGGNSAESFRTKTPQSTDTRIINVEGKQATVAIEPGPSTLTAGAKDVRFDVKVLSGDANANFHPVWHIVKDTNGATINADGHAVFPLPGEVTVAAIIPGEVKHERFYFVSSLGKVAKGAELLQPRNFDVLGMLLAFAATMYLSSALMAQPTANMDPDQAAIQKQTQQTMPLAVTVMFFFFALPAGVYLYLVVSNIMQMLQTWMIYRTPSVDPGDDSGDSAAAAGTPPSNGGKISGDDSGNGSDAGEKISVPKKKAQKKK